MSNKLDFIIIIKNGDSFNYWRVWYRDDGHIFFKDRFFSISSILEKIKSIGIDFDFHEDCSLISVDTSNIKSYEKYNEFYEWVESVVIMNKLCHRDIIHREIDCVINRYGI